MSKAAFPVNDLRRRKLQTALIIATLTLSVASTLFLLLFSSRIGTGIASATGTLTQGLTNIFSQFILYLGVLIFTVGAVLNSFMISLMMAQRTRDFGLIKAAGCPNSLVAGYFMTELLTVTLTGCVLGIGLGFTADYVAAQLVFSMYQLPNLWFVPIVFIAFFILALIFGVKPLLKAAKMSPAQAISPVDYYGLVTTKKHKVLSRSSITWKISSRSLFRRQSATIRIVILLTVVFILLTLTVAGGIIASQTTVSWIEKPVGENTLAIAHITMAAQYELLLSKFSGAQEVDDFNYSDPKLAIPDTVIQRLTALPSVSLVDPRLILKEHVIEVANFTISPDTLETFSVGDRREGDSLVIGVNTNNITSSWSMQGRLWRQNNTLEAIIGDSIAHSMFSPNPSKKISLSDPLVEGITVQNTTFRITGVCIDPINNGLVTYVPIETLKNITRIFSPNMLLVKLNQQVDQNLATSEIKNVLEMEDSSFAMVELNTVVGKNKSFLGSTWSTIMLLPTFTLASAALCLVGYMMLVADEQHQEFAILRAIGAKPKIVINILAIQSLLVLLSSFGVGISFGVMITLLILMSQPLVTTIAIVEISVWLLTALIGMFILSLYPAFKLAKTSILKIIT